MICGRCGWETGHYAHHGPVEVCLAASRKAADAAQQRMRLACPAVVWASRSGFRALCQHEIGHVGKHRDWVGNESTQVDAGREEDGRVVLGSVRELRRELQATTS